MDWFSFQGIFIYLFAAPQRIAAFGALGLYLLHCRSQQRHKMGDSDAEDVLIGWQTLGAKPCLLQSRRGASFRMETLTYTGSSLGEGISQGEEKTLTYFTFTTNIECFNENRI